MCTNRLAIRCLRAGRGVYQALGLKHPLLFSLYAFYLLLGATAFFLLEAEHAQAFKKAWLQEVEDGRALFLRRSVLPAVFNNSEFLVFINAEKTAGIEGVLDGLLSAYEERLGVRPPMPRYDWDFPNAVLFAAGLATTIGYGFLWPMTRSGQIASMIFSTLAIPFTLVVLQDLAGLLAKLLNYPGLVLGKCWQVFRFCTLPAVSEEKLHLAGQRGGSGGRRRSGGKLIFETILNTPTLIAVFALVGWIFAASFTFCVWEDWDVLTAFYFCFNSLSTIGIGDVVPTKPRLHLVMFIYIYLGLAVVSLFINLIYAKLTRAYWLDFDPQHPYRTLPTSTSSGDASPSDAEAAKRGWLGRQKPKNKLVEVGVGCDTVDETCVAPPRAISESAYDEAGPLPPKAPRPDSDTYETFAELISTSDLDLGSCVTLGVFQMQDRKPLLDAIKRTGPRRSAKQVQTTLSLPTRRTVQVERLADRCQVLPPIDAPRGFHWSHSVDDVTRLLVDTYE